MSAAAQAAERGRKHVFVNRFFDPDESATSQLLTDLARGLVARGFEVHVVCSRQLYINAAARLPARDIRAGVIVHRVATTRFGRARLIGRGVDYASFYFSAATALLRLLRAGDVLIAKTDPPLIGVLGAFIALVKRASLVNWQQDVFPEAASLLEVNPLPGWLDRRLRRLRDVSLRRAQMNVLISHRMREYFLSRAVPPAKLTIIENWADPAAIEPKPARASALRAEAGFGGKFVIGYSGNLGRAHEFATVLFAAQGLREDDSIIFLMIGGGAAMSALQRAAEQLGLANMRFLPYQPRERLADTLAAADAHWVSLLPPLEGLISPSKVSGILAAGRPLIYIGDPHSDIARMIDEAGCGVAIPGNASAALVAAIQRLQAEPSVCADMGARGRRLFLARYTLDQALDSWSKQLSLIPRRRAAAAALPAPSDR